MKKMSLFDIFPDFEKFLKSIKIDNLTQDKKKNHAINTLPNTKGNGGDKHKRTTDNFRKIKHGITQEEWVKSRKRKK